MNYMMQIVIFCVFPLKSFERLLKYLYVKTEIIIQGVK